MAPLYNQKTLNIPLEVQLPINVPGHKKKFQFDIENSGGKIVFQKNFEN